MGSAKNVIAKLAPCYLILIPLINVFRVVLCLYQEREKANRPIFAF